MQRAFHAAGVQKAQHAAVSSRMRIRGWCALVLAAVVRVGEVRADPPAGASQQWAQIAAHDGAQCRADLTAAGVRFRALPDRTAPDARGCGIPHGVVVTRGPTGIVYDAPLVIDCSLARDLPQIEAAIQEAATMHLGHPITRIGTLGTFSCRTMRGYGMLSEHALGNAIDMARFVPSRGGAVTVVRDYDGGAPMPRTERGMFLRQLELALRGIPSLTYVLGPWYDSNHRDHFHVDRGWRW